MPREIDYIVCYIDYTQKEIVELWEKTTGKTYGNSFNHDYLDFSLVLKQVLKNIPFINHLYVVCKDIQKLSPDVEKLIKESNGRIIRINESQILPENYITFSSACVEMFLWKIQGLSEYFIYGNDDMIPLKPLKIENFFENDKPIMQFNKYSAKFGCLYDLHNSNNTNLIFERTKNNDEYCQVLRTEHTIRPIRKSICQKCYNDFKPFILSSLYPVRFYNNFNFDIFMLYGAKHDLIIDKKLTYKFSFTEAKPDRLLRYSMFIENGDYRLVPDIICINDSTSINEDKCEKTKSEFINLIEKIDNPKPENSNPNIKIRRFGRRF